MNISAELSPRALARSTNFYLHLFVSLQRGHDTNNGDAHPNIAVCWCFNAQSPETCIRQLLDYADIQYFAFVPPALYCTAVD